VELRSNPEAVFALLDALRQHFSRLQALDWKAGDKKEFLNELSRLEDVAVMLLKTVRARQDNENRLHSQGGAKVISLPRGLVQDLEDYSDKLLVKQHELHLYIPSKKFIDFSKERVRTGVGR